MDGVFLFHNEKKTTPWHVKDRFSGFPRREHACEGRQENFKMSLLITVTLWSYMGEILLIRRKTLNNQSVIRHGYMVNRVCYLPFRPSVRPPNYTSNGSRCFHQTFY